MGSTLTRQRALEANHRTSAADHQREVEDFFASAATYWKDVYQDDRLLATIYRQRQAAALRWVDELGLAASSLALEVGCGAGLTTVALARRGYTVYAVDSARAMLEITKQEATVAGLSSRVIPEMGDVHRLAFSSHFFDLILALGVIPWLHSETRAIHEMARVLKPGGFLIVSADNRLRLSSLVDPRATPLLAPLRQNLKRLLRLLRLRNGQPSRLQGKMHDPQEIDGLIAAVGLQKVKGKSLGFGPFSLFGMGVIPDSAGLPLHRILQRLADRGIPGLRSTGSHYLLLAQKPRGRVLFEQDARARDGTI